VAELEGLPRVSLTPGVGGSGWLCGLVLAAGKRSLAARWAAPELLEVSSGVGVLTCGDMPCFWPPAMLCFIRLSGTVWLYHWKGFWVAITASEARKRLFPLIKQVNDDRAAVEIVSNHGRAYLVAADDYESMAETDYLLRSPANAARLMAAADDVRHGRTLLAKDMTELEAMASDGEPG
jgi:antitoxin YefM